MLEGALRVVPEGDEHGDVLGVELALLELIVEGGEQLGGREAARGEGAQDAADESGVERGGGGLSARRRPTAMAMRPGNSGVL